MLPYQVDVPEDSAAVSNGIIILGTIIFSMAVLFGKIPADIYEPMILEEFNAVGLFGSMVLHGDLMHLIGNMLMLWVFGNAICAKLGNWMYVAAYLLLGAAAGTAHLLGDGGRAIGASGAIMGIVGMFIVLYPSRKVSCWWCIWIIVYFQQGKFKVDARLLIMFWFVMDMAGALGNEQGIAFLAHIGGFVGGFFLAAVLVWGRVVALTPDDQTLFDVVGADVGRRVEAPIPQTVVDQRVAPPETNWPDAYADEPEPAPAPGEWIPNSDAPPELTLDAPAPGPAPVATQTPSAPSVAPAPAESTHVVVACECGHKMRAPLRMVGRKAKCKKCGGKFYIPMPDELDLGFD